MKQLLRKFHFGGNHYDRLDGERMLEARGSTADGPSAASPSTPVEHRPSSGISGWLSSRARHGSQAPSSSHQVNNSRLQSQTSAGGNEILGRATSPVDSSGGTQLDFEFLEEEYQVQLAMALSVSKDEISDPEALEIEAVKKISLGLCPMPNNAHVEAAAYRYWAYHVLDYDDRVLNGFYDVHSVLNPDTSERMPSLFDLQGTSVSESTGYEVVLVNRVTDYDLVKLEQRVTCLAMDPTINRHGPLRSGLAQKIAEVVAEQMGGPVASDVELLAVWKTTSWELKSFAQNIVLPLGALQIGLARHRALLFKVLADCVGIPCRLVKGRYYTGVDDGAVNILKDDDGREYIVDLIGAPGAMIPLDAPMKTSIVDQAIMHIAPFPQSLPDGQSSDSARSSGASIRGTLMQGSIPNKISLNLEKSAIDNLEDFEEKKACTTDYSGQHHMDSETKTISASLSGASEMLSPVGVEMNSTCLRSSEISVKTDLAQNSHHGLLEEGQSSGFLVKPSLKEFDHQSFDERFVHTQTLPDWKSSDDKKGLNERKRNRAPRPKQVGSAGPGRPPLRMPRHKLDIVQEDAVNRLQGQKSVEELDDRQETKFCAGQILLTTLAETSGTNVQDTAPHKLGANAEVVGPSITTPAVASSSLKGKVEYDPSSQHSRRRAAEVTVITPAVPNCVESGTAFEQSSSILESQLKKTSRDSLQLDEAYNVRINSTSSSSSGQGQSDCGPVVIDKGGRKDGIHVSSWQKLSRFESMLGDAAEWEILWDDLSLGERIGLGSYGEVYHGDWNGTEVAVKKFLDQDISGDALEEFRREVRIMRRLRHPNVVLFMGAVARAPNLSIVTEFLPRGSLYRLIHRPNNDLDERRRLRMALDVVRGMNYLHTSTPIIVHRDLKSPNLLVDKHWVVKVCDFGLSRMKHNTFLSSMSTAGTPEWMAPEVLRNEPSNEKSDVYSFGVILWELATSQQPWSGLNPMQVVGAVGFQHRRLVIPQDVDPQISQIIQDCWQNEPSLRPSFSQIMTTLKPLQRLVRAPQPYDYHRHILQ